MIKMALSACNATPSLRPSMTQAVNMLKEQTDIQDVISDPSIFIAKICNLKPFKARVQEEA